MDGTLVHRAAAFMKYIKAYNRWMFLRGEYRYIINKLRSDRERQNLVKIIRRKERCLT